MSLGIGSSERPGNASPERIRVVEKLSPAKVVKVAAEAFKAKPTEMGKSSWVEVVKKGR